MNTPPAQINPAASEPIPDPLGVGAQRAVPLPASAERAAVLPVVIALALVVIALTARVLPGPRTIDDAFITFRYSRNMVEGQGFVYNPGVHVMGTTTPLYTLLMAAVSAVDGGPNGSENFQWYAIIVNALADAGTCVFLYLLARRVTRENWIAALPGLLWAISPMSVTFAVGGMETSLAIFWMVGAVWWLVAAEKKQSAVSDQRSAKSESAASDKWPKLPVLLPSPLVGEGSGVRGTRSDILLGLFCALGFLTRIDAALWIGPILLYQWIDRWRTSQHQPILQRQLWVTRIPWVTWLTGVLVFLPWLIFSLAYFGSPFPNSVAAKTVAYQIAPGSAFVTFLRTYSIPFFEYELFGSVGAMVGAVVYLTLSIFGVVYAARRLPRLLPFLLYFFLYVVVFSIFNPLIFRWYLAPPLPAFIFAIFIGVWALIEPLRRKVKNPRLAPVIFGLVGLLWTVTSISGWTLHPDHEPDRPAPKMAWHLIEIYYQQIGAALREEYGVTPQTRVASADIGAVGYFSRATIIDTIGLVTPALSHYYPAPLSLVVEGQNYAIPPQLILDQQPEYLVTMEAFVRLGLEQTPEFKSEYTMIREIPTDFYGTGMLLYQRR